MLSNKQFEKLGLVMGDIAFGQSGGRLKIASNLDDSEKCLQEYGRMRDPKNSLDTQRCSLVSGTAGIVSLSSGGCLETPAGGPSSKGALP